MKTLFCLCIAAVSLAAQVAPVVKAPVPSTSGTMPVVKPPVVPVVKAPVGPPSASVTAQVAQAVMVNLPADLATAIEKHRVDTFTTARDPKTGAITRAPVYATTQEFLMFVLSSQNGYFDFLVTRYPPDDLKAAQDAAAKVKAAKLLEWGPTKK